VRGRPVKAGVIDELKATRETVVARGKAKT
jgi:hypothetical protein